MKTSPVLLFLGALALAQNPQTLPPPFETPSVQNAATIVPRPADAQLTAPKGFSVSEYAHGLQRPRFMVEGPGGEILLSDTIANGSVIALKNGTRTDLLTGLDRPYGLALWHEYLYVGQPESVTRYKYDSHALTATQPQVVVAMPGYVKGHVTRTILFDETANKMYLAVGSSGDLVVGDPEMRAAVNSYNPDGSGHEIFATGVRNPVGLRFNPFDHSIWATVEERNELGDGLVADYFTSLRRGGFYGWPYAYLGPHPDPRIAEKDRRPDLVNRAIAPDVPLTPHCAVLDFVFYTGTQFPAQYRSGAFLANHGSSNRADRVGYSVSFVPFQKGKPAGPVRDFLTGWMLGPDRKEVWGRPVGLLQLRDGSLLISDDGGKKIWRVTYGKPNAG